MSITQKLRRKSKRLLVFTVVCTNSKMRDFVCFWCAPIIHAVLFQSWGCILCLGCDLPGSIAGMMAGGSVGSFSFSIPCSKKFCRKEAAASANAFLSVCESGFEGPVRLRFFSPAKKRNNSWLQSQSQFFRLLLSCIQVIRMTKDVQRPKNKKARDTNSVRVTGKIVGLQSYNNVARHVFDSVKKINWTRQINFMRAFASGGHESSAA